MFESSRSHVMTNSSLIEDGSQATLIEWLRLVDVDEASEFLSCLSKDEYRSIIPEYLNSLAHYTSWRLYVTAFYGIIVGLVGSTLSLVMAFLLSRTEVLCRNTRLIFTALEITDSIVCTSQACIYIFGLTLKHTVRTNNYNVVWCQAIAIASEKMSMAVSNSLLAVITLERLLAIYRPLWYKNVLKPSTRYPYAAVVLGITLGLMFRGYRATTWYPGHVSNSTFVLTRRPPNGLLGLWSWVAFWTYDVVLVSFMTCSTILISYKLATKSTASDTEAKNMRNATRMVIGICVLYILEVACNLGLLCSNRYAADIVLSYSSCLDNFRRATDANLVWREWHYITPMVTVTCHSVNSIVFLVFNRGFRAEASGLLIEKCPGLVKALLTGNSVWPSASNVTRD